MTIKNDLKNNEDAEKEQKESKGLLSYKGTGEQTVFRILGIELTAPAGLKNPGIVYLSFIVVNFILFLVLRSFINK